MYILFLQFRNYYAFNHSTNILSIYILGALTTWNRPGVQAGPDDDGARTVENREDIEEEDTQLMQCLSFIQRVHRLQYPENQSSSSISNVPTVGTTVLDHTVSIRQNILKGYAFAFSGVFPTNYPMNKHPLYQTCVSLGAEICSDVTISQSSRVTHLLTVETHMNSSKVQSCISSREDVWIVHKDWLR